MTLEETERQGWVLQGSRYDDDLREHCWRYRSKTDGRLLMLTSHSNRQPVFIAADRKFDDLEKAMAALT